MEDYRVTQTGDEIQEIFNQSPVDTADIAELKEAATSLDGRLEAVEGKIPSGASSENPLTDKQYVDSSIASASATFRGTYNEVTDLELTTEGTHAEIGEALASVIDTADSNDYCFVQIPTADATPTEIESIERYKFVTGTGWQYEYTLNNSGFTADQWAAINSGITSVLVAKLTDLPTNAELNTLLNGKANAADVYTKSETYTKTEIDTQLGAKANSADVYPKTDTYTKQEVNALITTPEVQYVTVTATSGTTSVTDVLPATGAANTIYRVGSWDGTQYDTGVYSEYAWNGTTYILLDVKNYGFATGSDFDNPTTAQRELVTTVGSVLDGISEGVFDLTAKTGDSYATLADALTAANTAIPTNKKKGGMSIKFVQSYDNKYVQFRYMLEYANTTAGNAAFVNVANWQGVDDEPTAGSKNLVESGGVYDNIGNPKYYQSTGAIATAYESGILDFYINAELINLRELSLTGVSNRVIIYAKVGESNTWETLWQLYYNDTYNWVNNKVINIVVNNVTIGYIVFKDKQKFSDNTYAVYLPINLNYLTNPHLHTYATLPVACVGSDELKSLSVINSKIKDSEVSLNKLDSTIIDTSVNLFNKDTIGVGYIKNDGTVIQDSGWWHSDYIPVKPNTTYKLTSSRDAAIYNASKVKIAYGNYGVTLNTPANAAYFRFSQTNSVSAGTIMMNEGSTLLPYQPYTGTTIKQDLMPKLTESKLPDSFSGEKITDRTVDKKKLSDTFWGQSNNLFNKDTATNGAYINYHTGLPISYSGWWYSDYIEVSPNTAYSISNMRDYAYYNENKAYVSGGTAIVSGSFTTPANVKYIRFSWNVLSAKDTCMMNIGDTLLPYEPYYVFQSELIPKSSSEVVDVSLPKKIYAVVGDTLQLFFRGMVKAVNPYIYDLCVTALGGGRMYPRYYQLQAAGAGTFAFTLNIKDNNGKILGGGSTMIHVKNAVSQPSSALNVLFIGDSLTNNGVYTQEAYRRLTGTGGTPEGKGFGNINFVGRKPYGSIHAEGNHGWTWSDYLTAGRTAWTFEITAPTVMPTVGSVYKDSNNKEYVMWWDYSTTKIKLQGSDTPPASGTLTKKSGTGDEQITYSSVVQSSANPFWNDSTGELDVPAYVDKWCGGDIDVVYTLLSWNGQTANRTDFSAFTNYAKTLFRHIHTNYPNAVIKMMGIQVPDTRQGMGAIGVPREGGYTDMYGLICTALNMNKAYEDMCLESEFSEYVEFVNVSSQVDSEYNMPFTEKDVNTRNSEYKDLVGTNDVHPNNAGYLQIADVVYRNFIANFCQGT